MTEITLKKGSGKPADAALVEAEFALDVSTGKIYSKLSDGKVRALNDAEFIGIDANADNYQYWQYKINGFGTTSVMSTSVLDFQSGDGIQIDKEGYGIKISASGSSGGGVLISDTEPSDPYDGMMWLDSTTAIVWVWDENKWLEFPAAVADEYDDTQIKADLATETQARSDADADLQSQIDNLPTGGGASTHVGDTAPDSPTEGQMWLNSDDGYLYVYYDNAGNPTWMAVEREA